MDDLISKRTAIDALRAIKQGLWEIDIPSPTVPEYIEHHEQIKNMMEIVDGWIRRIKAEPSVDAVQIVRCRECVYGELAYCDLDGEEWVCCRNLGGGKMGKGDGFDFCSYGERREE